MALYHSDWCTTLQEDHVLSLQLSSTEDETRPSTNIGHQLPFYSMPHPGKTDLNYTTPKTQQQAKSFVV